MALDKYLVSKLHRRDTYCWHCGEDRKEYLVPHHRRNRGMGGRGTLLDRLDNLILVCAEYNGAMESKKEVRDLAIDYRHKLGQWAKYEDPVFDAFAKCWYILHTDGKKEPAEELPTIF